jgi:hypothetical protein
MRGGFGKLREATEFDPTLDRLHQDRADRQDERGPALVLRALVDHRDVGGRTPPSGGVATMRSAKLKVQTPAKDTQGGEWVKDPIDLPLTIGECNWFLTYVTVVGVISWDSWIPHVLPVQNWPGPFWLWPRLSSQRWPVRPRVPIAINSHWSNFPESATGGRPSRGSVPNCRPWPGHMVCRGPSCGHCSWATRRWR